MKIMQTTTGKSFPLIESTSSEWASELPSDEVGGIAISEGVGTINGSVFCYWIGDQDITDPYVLALIQRHLNDHDVVGVRYILERPAEVHPAIHTIESGRPSVQHAP